MARVTVEDCVDKIENRFDLVMLAARRARQLGSGAPLEVDRDDDKNPVVALREIAGEKLELDSLQEELVRTHQRVQTVEEDTSELAQLMESERSWLDEQQALAAPEPVEDPEDGEPEERSAEEEAMHASDEEGDEPLLADGDDFEPDAEGDDFGDFEDEAEDSDA